MNPHSHPQALDIIVRKMHVSQIVGLSTTHVEKLIREGKFPASFKISEGGRASGWFQSPLTAWLSARALANSKPSAK